MSGQTFCGMLRAPQTQARYGVASVDEENLSKRDTTWDDLVSGGGKNAAAVALGRRGGVKGGPARALALSAEKRSSIAKTAALARWSKVKGDEGDTE